MSLPPALLKSEEPSWFPNLLLKESRLDQTRQDQTRPDQTRQDQISVSAKAEVENEGENENIFQVCGRKMNLTLGTPELSHACPLDRQAYNLSQESITCAEVPHSCWVVFRFAREIASDPFSSHLTVDWKLTALFAVRFCGAWNEWWTERKERGIRPTCFFCGIYRLLAPWLEWFLDHSSSHVVRDVA